MYICAYNKKMEIEYAPGKEALNPLSHEGVTFAEANHGCKG